MMMTWCGGGDGRGGGGGGVVTTWSLLPFLSGSPSSHACLCGSFSRFVACFCWMRRIGV